MRQTQTIFHVRTRGKGLHLITDEIEDWIGESGGAFGLLTLLCQHTSASLTLHENVSADARRDLDRAFDRLAPRDADYEHRFEGPDDMPAHIRTVLSGAHLSIPVAERRLALGTWQGIYLWEHRDQPHERRVAAHLLYEIGA